MNSDQAPSRKQRKFPLAKMLEEILDDEIVADRQETTQLSQDDILQMVRKKRNRKVPRVEPGQ